MKIKYNNIFNKSILNNNFLFIIPFIILSFLDLYEHNDSISYIDNYSRRPFLYPLIIDLFQFMSNNNYKFYLKLFQISISAYSILFFLNFYNSKFKPNKVLLILIFTVILIPNINFSMPLANSILSESIAYPIFLLFVIFFFKFLLNSYKIKNLIILMILVFLLISSRSQFLIILPLIFFVIFIKFLKNKKILIISILVLFLTYLISLFSQITYNKIKYEYNDHINIGSFQFIALSHFVSDKQNFDNLKDPIQKDIVNLVNEYLVKNHNFKINNLEKNYFVEKNLKYLIKNLRKNYNSYYHFYIPIIHAYEYEVPNIIKLSNNENDNLNKINKEVFKIAINLILQSPKEYLVLYFTNIIFGLGGYFVEAENLKGLLMNVGFSGSYLFFIQISIVFYFSFKILVLREKCINEVYLLLSSILNIFNVCFICLFEPAYDRYIFYTNIIFLIFLLNMIFNSNPKIQNI